MLALFLILGSSIAVVLLREARSETYRCRKCSQLHAGAYHRRKCSVLGRENDRKPSRVEMRDFRYATRPSRLDGMYTTQRRRFSNTLPGLWAHRAVKGATAALGRYVHVAF